MIGLSLPDSGNFGWGVCADNLRRELKALTKIVEASTMDDFPLEIYSPILHAIQGVNLLPLRPNFWSVAREVGYCFVEDNILVGQYALNATRNFAHVATGSSWCTEQLKNAGLIDVCTVIQGVDSGLYNYDWPDRAFNNDHRFIVFSGGKAETRKGQDVVIKAMEIFMAAHDDVWLTANWFNPWRTPGYNEIIQKYMYSRIPKSRTLGLGLDMIPHDKVKDIYSMADIGLFPNRCEAGNNMVMCELMALGKSVIATYATGHKDVLSAGDPLILEANKDLPVKNAQGKLTGIWIEPNLDEIVAKLEWAYNNRGKLDPIGKANRERMRQFTWASAARQFMGLLGVAS